MCGTSRNPATHKRRSAGTSCPSAIGYALKALMSKVNDLKADDLDDDQEYASSSITQVAKSNAIKCPQCGESLAFEGGCNICKACGWSKCD